MPLPVLDDPATHIRLLEVCDNGGAVNEATIRISLTTVPFLEAPTYHAISYTWGDPGRQHVIAVTDGDSGTRGDAETRPMTVHQNCADVLRQVLHFKTSKYYWIDAICIDQSNNHEKSYQVAMMGSIFERAERVLCCVGKHQDDSKFMIDLFDDLDRYLGSHDRSTADLISRRDWTVEQRWTLSYIAHWLDTVSDKSTLRFYKALDAFAERSYFWRIWILQEMFLARLLSIFCEFNEIFIPTLLFWWEDAKAQWFFQHRDDIAAGREPPILLRKKLTASEAGKQYLHQAKWNNIDFYLDYGACGLGYKAQVALRERALPCKYGLERRKIFRDKILLLCENRNCQDPRDTIYGTLALTDWTILPIATPSGHFCKSVKSGDDSDNEELRPDYNKSVYDLAREIMQHFKEMGDLVKLIIHMLKLGPTDQRVSNGIASRHRVKPVATVHETDDVLTLSSKSDQPQLQLVEGGFQLKSDSIWKMEQHPVSGNVNICLRDHSSSFYAIASATTKMNDWILPTFNGYGFVIRQIRAEKRFFAIVGKVWFPAQNLPRDLQLTGFMMWLGLDDLLVHIAGGFSSLLSSNRPSDNLTEILNDAFCLQQYSSFAEVPGIMRTWVVPESAARSQSNTWELIGDWHRALADHIGTSEVV